jgi:serine/threonine-protein kinase
LRKEWWRDVQAIEMLRREAWIGRRLAHPHIAPVLSAQVDQPPIFVVTPYLIGETAAEMVEKKQLPSLPLALWIVRQVAEALHELHHSLGMVHADVKPANILVSPDGHTTLLDFGCAQTLAEARSWATRPVVGTLHYAAPEMITSACAIDPRCDIYSLGVTLYELLTGALPFDATEPAQLVMMHRSAKPTCVRNRRPNLPKPIASLVHRMLAKEPLRRPATAADVVDELVRLEIESFAAR